MGRPTWVREHLPFIATLVFFLLLGLKVLAVAHFDADSALQILATSGPVSVAVGAFISGSPSLSYLVVLAVFFWFARHFAEASMVQVTLAVFVGLVALMFVLMLYPVVILIMSIAGVYIGWRFPDTSARSSTGDVTPPDSWFTRPRLVGVLLGLLLAGHVLDTRVWLPREKLSLNSGTTMVAYVLEDEGPWLTFLTEKERAVQVVRVVEVENRQVCYRPRDGGFLSFRLVELVDGESLSPVCPD